MPSRSPYRLSAARVAHLCHRSYVRITWVGLPVRAEKLTAAPASLAITGTFSGDVVNLALEDNFCPPRQGTATRQAISG